MLKNFKPVSLILCAGALCFSGSMYANIAPVEQGTSISQQNGKVTGTVEDDFGPVTGASVVVKGTSNGTITDMDGNYSMRVETRAGDNLVATYIGMKKATIPVKGKMTINIVMQDETVMLEGPTIVGNKRVNNGMMDVSERDLTTAMSRISMSDLEDGMTAPLSLIHISEPTRH